MNQISTGYLLQMTDRGCSNTWGKIHSFLYFLLSKNTEQVKPCLYLCKNSFESVLMVYSEMSQLKRPQEKKKCILTEIFHFYETYRLLSWVMIKFIQEVPAERRWTHH